MNTIVFGSSNPHKLKEITHMMRQFESILKLQVEYDVPDIEETGLSFIENALLKARNAAQHTGLPAFADDSGLMVDALNGQPGIYTARYARPGATHDENNQKLLHTLANLPHCSRTARFVCAIVFVEHATDPLPKIFQGVWEGKILTAPRGEHGFGYDPVFYVPTHDCSAAELPDNIKNTISHRGQAIIQFKQYLEQHLLVPVESP